jgi:hypothetical protein
MPALESFRNQPRFPVFLPRDQSPDQALNRDICPLSIPDRKFFSRNGVGGLSDRISRRESGCPEAFEELGQYSADLRQSHEAWLFLEYSGSNL